MIDRLSKADMLGLGFMTFAFFLGAGNIIFPPLAGMFAGQSVLPAMLGFLTTAVGLPLLGLFAVARAGGGIPEMTKPLAAWVGVVLSVAIYTIIGPLIAAPRTALVAFELGYQPFYASAEGSQVVYSAVFFSVATALALYPGKLMDSVGKILTPLLIILLLTLSATVLLGDAGDLQLPVKGYESAPYVTGFIEGYNTMDALASIMFGMLIIDILKKKGVTAPSAQYRYLVVAAVIAALGLAAVYISLFYLGANNAELVPDAQNGGAILSAYVQQQFGLTGSLVLAGVITLACLTTAVGLISACSDYFNSLLPRVSYRAFVFLNALVCIAIANLDLSKLIGLSIPVLVASYPIAIALIIYSLVKARLATPHMTLIAVLVVSTLFGFVEGAKVAGVEMSWLAFLPFFDVGMAWVSPIAIVISASIFIRLFKISSVTEVKA